MSRRGWTLAAVLVAPIVLGLSTLWALHRVAVAGFAAVGALVAALAFWRFVRRERPGADRAALIAAGLLMVGAFTALGQIDAVLTGMHPPGKSSFGIASLVPPIGDPDDAERTQRVLGTWQAHCDALTSQCPPRPGDQSRSQYVEATTVVRLYLVVDWFLFIPAYAGFLWAALRLGGKHLRGMVDQDDPRIARHMAQLRLRRLRIADPELSRHAFDDVYQRRAHTATTFGVRLVLAAALFDAVENFWYYRVLTAGWRRPGADLQAEVTKLWAFTWFKWLAIGLALLVAVVLFATLLSLHQRERRELLQALFLFRVQLLLLVVFGLLLLVHEQVPDVLRRWGMDLNDLLGYLRGPSEGVVDTLARPTTDQAKAVTELSNAFCGIVLTLLLGCSIAVTAAQLAQRARRSPERLPSFAGRRLLLLLLAPAGVTLCVWALVRWWDPDVVAIAGPAVLVVYLLLYTLRGAGQRRATTSRRRTGRAWQWIEDHTPVALILSILPVSLLFFFLPLPGGARMAGAEIFLPLALLGFIALLGQLAGDPPATPRLGLGWGLNLLPGVLGGIPAGVLGLALLRSFVAETVYVQRDEFAQGGSDGFAILLGVLLLAATPALAGALARRSALDGREPAESRWHRGTILALAALAALAYLGVVRSVQEVTPTVGTIGVVAAFLALAGGLGSWLALLVERYRAPAAFQLFSLTRAPLLLLIALWLVVASTLDKGGGFYRVETLETAPAGERLTLEAAFTRWADANCLPDPPAEQPAAGARAEPPRAPRTGVPLVFVAASGGGIRAAFWTSLVLDQTLGRPAGSCSPAGAGATADPAPAVAPLFAASGVSGSSLGLVAYVADQLTGSSAGVAGWPANRLGGDYLAANIAWASLVEVPRSMVRFTGVRDRGRVLEEAWEHSWSDDDPAPGLRQGLTGLYRGDERQPLLLLNGTSVESGCRFLASPLVRDQGPPEVQPSDCLALQPPRDGGQPRPLGEFPGVTMLTDLLCDGQDVRLSTAALLSARFPFVSPSGRVDDCPEPGEEAAERPRTYVVDGGYFDNSASWTVMDLWGATQPLIDRYNRLSTTHCVVPFLLQLDNGYDNPRAPDPTPRPDELRVPMRGVSAARDSQSVSVRQQAESTFGRPFELANAQQVTLDGKTLERRYNRFVPQAHPGSQAPLGWALSERTMNDLRTQLTQFNGPGLAEVHRWLDGKLTCEARR